MGILVRIACAIVGHTPSPQDSLGQGFCKRCYQPLSAADYRKPRLRKQNSL
jgi:hypothetical protein